MATSQAPTSACERYPIASRDGEHEDGGDHVAGDRGDDVAIDHAPGAHVHGAEAVEDARGKVCRHRHGSKSCTEADTD